MNRLPSVKTLATIFGPNAKEARKILEYSRHELLANNEAARKRLNECYHAPKTYDLRLHALNALGEFFGLESAETNEGEWLTYLNAGDTYAGTICYWRGRYYVASSGAMIESLEKKRIYFK